VIQGELLRQASMLSFTDAFYLITIFTILTLLLVPLIKKGKEDFTVSGMH
jgi:hypothetical protein